MSLHVPSWDLGSWDGRPRPFEQVYSARMGVYRVTAILVWGLGFRVWGLGRTMILFGFFQGLGDFTYLRNSK